MGLPFYLFFAAVVFMASPVDAAGRTISVGGVGTASAEPDMAELGVAVVANRETAAAAMAEASNKAAAVLESLASHGIADKDIQTGSVSLNPVYRRNRDGPDREPVVIGYRASIDNRVLVRRPGALGRIIDDLSKAGVDRISGIRFLVADNAALLAGARRNAVANAMTAAKQLAAAAGVELGEVVSITDVPGGGPVPQPRLMAMAAVEKAVPLMPGEVVVRVNIRMIFAIK